jgi:hypothetical protein
MVGEYIYFAEMFNSRIERTWASWGAANSTVYCSRGFTNRDIAVSVTMGAMGGADLTNPGPPFLIPSCAMCKLIQSSHLHKSQSARKLLIRASAQLSSPIVYPGLQPVCGRCAHVIWAEGSVAEDPDSPPAVPSRQQDRSP